MEVLTFRLWVSLAIVLMINWRIKQWTIPLSFSLALAHFAFQINRFFFISVPELVFCEEGPIAY